MSNNFDKFISGLEEQIKDAPETRPETEEPQAAPSLEFPKNSGIPKRYLEPDWLPADKTDWKAHYLKAKRVLHDAGILSLVGGRGTGKTRLAIEVCRRANAKGTRYMAAMDVFLRLQSCYRKGASESELAVLQELARARILVLDEIQERGNTEWEDRVLTHLIDKRYGAMLPTILIANLKPNELKERLGPSIIDRMHEGGGLLEIAGQSHRKTNRENG